jgi:hypothetical protein
VALADRLPRAYQRASDSVRSRIVLCVRPHVAREVWSLAFSQQRRDQAAEDVSPAAVAAGARDVSSRAAAGRGSRRLVIVTPLGLGVPASLIEAAPCSAAIVIARVGVEGADDLVRDRLAHLADQHAAIVLVREPLELALSTHRSPHHTRRLSLGFQRAPPTGSKESSRHSSANSAPAS